MAGAPRIVAVIDIGKTNAKLVAFDRDSGTEIDVTTAAIASREDGPYRHLDSGRIWDFICDGLAAIARRHAPCGIVVTAHGSAGAFLNGEVSGDGLTLPILDYEDPGPDDLAIEYDAVRPDFAETFSPRLPGGLNLGAQIFWQQQRFPAETGRAVAYVNYPQYWAWRLTGVMATEMCSMGAHSDLWNPRSLDWSGLVGAMGWRAILAPLRRASDVLGPVRSDLARRLGLPDATPVLCGIHDSSASLLPHLGARTPPFTVASTGTWTIFFAVGGSLASLDPARDTLANVTPRGDPVPCARFMGGREFETLAGSDPAVPSESDAEGVISRGVMATPTFTPGVGPYPHRKGAWTEPPEGLAPGERTAAASLYLALMSAQSIACTGAQGPTIVEGPLAQNRLYCAALARLTARPVLAVAVASGPARGAAQLFGGAAGGNPLARPVAPLGNALFDRYANAWQDLARRC